MRFILELDGDLVTRYAEHLGYELEGNDANEIEMFKDTLAEILENTIDNVLD